jgi:uncharacterized membrane protein
VTGYEALKFLHILTAIVWLGGAILFQVLSIRAAGLADPSAASRIGQDAEWVGLRVFMPASILTLGFGIWMVLTSAALDFDELWINLGLAGFIVTFILGMGFINPTGKRIGKAMAERGPQDPVTQQLLRRQRFLTRLNVLLLIAVVFDMVVRPGT